MFDGYNDLLMFEPCDKLNKKIYRCDKRFHVEYLIKMYQKPIGSIGCVFVDGKVIKFVTIKSITKNMHKSKQIYSSTMKLIGKTKKGGSSSARYGRIRDNHRKGNICKISTLLVEHYYNFKTNKSLVDLMVICGPGTLKNEIYEDVKKYFNSNSIKIQPIDHFDASEIGSQFYGDLVDIKDRRILKPIDLMVMNPDLLIIGSDELAQSIESCNMKEIYVNSHDLMRDIERKIVHSPEIILVNNSNFLNSMGGFVGIKYY